MKLIVGLGNPGKEYASTRHNAGFMAVNFLAEHFGFPPFKKSEKHKAELSEGQMVGEKVILAKPQTYMNLSGQAVQSLVQFYKIQTHEVIVIYDEADLPLGTLRIRSSGSAAGHKGVKSILEQLGDSFVRIRLGIQPEKPFPEELEDHVLGQWTMDEKKVLNQLFKRLPSLIEALLKEGIEKAMEQFN